MGAGNTGTGSLRVTIATDQTQLTNKLLVTPDLPSGASTAAKQPALGTAGTASSDVITVQGVTSMTPLLVTPAANSAVNVAQINGVTPLMGTGNTGTGSLRVTIATDQTALTNPLLVTASAGTNLNTSALLTTAAHDAAFGTAGSADTQVRSVQGIASMTPLSVTSNSANIATETSLASLLTSSQLIDDTIFTDDAAFTPATSKVQVIGFQADEASTDSVDEGDAGAARMTLDRKQIVTPQPHSAGGCSIFRSIDLDEGTLEIVKNAAGCLYGIWATNLATTTRFIKIYDAASGTAGTGTPVITIPIPGNASDDIGAVYTAGGMGITFATGICIGATTGIADADTGAPGTNDVVVNVFYK
jgi:hypothetical protein